MNGNMVNMYSGNTSNKSKDENDSKKIFTVLILIVTIMVCTTSATYAYFALSATNTGTVTGTAATHSLTLTVTQATLKSSNTGVMVPQLASAIGTAMNSTNQCVDGNANIVCKVYTITIQNDSTAAVDLNGTITFTSPTTNLKWRRTASTTAVNGSLTTGSYVSSGISATTTRTDLISGTACTPSSSSSGCTSVKLTKSSSSTTTDAATYYLVIWINETGSSQGDSGTWSATITFEGADGRGITSTIRS